MSIHIAVIFCLLFAIIGFLTGISIGLRIHRAGTLVIDTTDPTIDRYSIMMETPFDELPKEKYVSLKIQVKSSMLSQSPENVVDLSKMLAPPYPEDVSNPQEKHHL